MLSLLAAMVSVSPVPSYVTKTQVDAADLSPAQRYVYACMSYRPAMYPLHAEVGEGWDAYVLRYAPAEHAPTIAAALRNECAHFGIDPCLMVAIIECESGFNPGARSGAGAVGLCQLMPSTARMLGVRDPWSIKGSIAGGTSYMSGLMKHGEYNALCRYNGGPKGPGYGACRAYASKVLGVRERVRAYGGF